MYLSTYLFRINIVYCFKKNYNNANKLLRLLINYVNINCYSIITIVISKEFLYNLCDALKVNSYF